MLTALGTVDDRVDALDIGADDYLVKPFEQRELEARLRAIVRRETGPKADLIQLANLGFSPSEMTATIGDRRLDLTRREATVLATFLRHPGQVLCKQRLYDSLFGFDDADVGINAIELYVARLRKKLTGSGVSISTQRGVGYRIGTDD